MNWKNKIIAITPFVSSIIFFVLWLQFDLAHPGWIAFLLIPLMPFLVGKKKMSVSIVIIIIYIIVSLVTKAWKVTWVIMLLIPIMNIILLPEERSRKSKLKDDEFDD